MYLFGTLLLLVPYSVLYYKKPGARREMFIMGLIFGVMAFLLSPYSIADYWHPTFIIKNFPLEDFLYGFLFGGFGAECAEIFYNRKHKKIHTYRLWFVAFLIFYTGITFYLVFSILHLNSIIAYFIPLTITGIFSILLNHRQFKFQIVSGLIALAVTFIIFKILLIFDPQFISNTWYLNNLSGILYFSIPVEEYLFAFLMGFGGSSIYEVTVGEV